MRIKPTFFYLVVALFIIVVIFLSWLSLSYRSELVKLKEACSRQIDKPSEKIISEVSKLISLPDETPTIATVSNLESLKGQPFFSQAQVGDFVLIFPTNRKAILYNQEKKKIVNVATIDWPQVGQ